MTTPDRSERFVSFVLRHRAGILILAGVLAVLSGWRTVLTYSNLKSDLEELLPSSAPSVAALEAARARLPGLRHLGVVVDTGGPANLDAANRFIDDLAERVTGYPSDVVAEVRVDVGAERRFAETYALQLMDPEDVAVLRRAVEERRDWEVTRKAGLDLLDDEEDPRPEIPLDRLRRKYEARYGAARDFPGDRLVSNDGRHVVMIVRAAAHGTSYDEDAELLSRVRTDIAHLGFPEAYDPALQVGFAGDVPTRVEEMDGLVTDLSISGALVAALVIAVVLWFFGSLRSLPVLFVPLLMGTLYTFALVALPPFSVRHLNSNTAFLGSIVVGNGINTGIILLARFREEQVRGASVGDGLGVAVRSTWRPTLAAACAASAAYGSLVFTDFRGFNQFGWIGGVGMLSCWATTLVVLPALVSIVGLPVGRAQPSSRSTGDRLAHVALARPGSVVLGTLVLVGASVVGTALRSSDWLETDFSQLRRRDSWQTGERYWGKKMDRTLGRYLTPTVVMADDAESARVIAARVRSLAVEERAGALISTVRDADTVLPPSRGRSIQEAKALRGVLTTRLKKELTPGERAQVERALSDASFVPLEADDVPPSLTAGLRERDGRIDRNVVVLPRATVGTWDADKMSDFTRDLRAAATVSDRRAPVAGSLLLSSDIVTAMKADGPRATALALGVVLVIALLAFRSVGLSLAAIASLLVGVTLMVGAMAWTGQKLNFSNFVALPITFGIGADYAINVLKRLQLDSRLDPKNAVAKTGGAVALCSATTIIGFGSLLVAQNRALFSFGVFAVAGEIACLAAAVWALPALLSLVARRVDGPGAAG